MRMAGLLAIYSLAKANLLIISPICPRGIDQTVLSVTSITLWWPLPMIGCSYYQSIRVFRTVFLSNDAHLANELALTVKMIGKTQRECRCC
jgi:hypothetical protein